MNIHQKLMVDTMNTNGLDFESVMNEIVKARLRDMAYKIDIEILSYLDPGKLAFLYSTGND